MPRRFLGILILLLVSVARGRAQGDVALFAVGNDTVTRGEFEYHWKRSHEKRMDVFLQKYGCFKKKVQYAKELGLDTLTEYRLAKEHSLRMFDRKGTDARKHASSSGHEWIRLLHVTCPLSQQASKRQALDAEAYLDSVYAVWKEGGQIRSEELAWVQTRYLLNEWQRQLDGLERNEFSRPFYSPLGVHLIAWTDKRHESGRNGLDSEADEAFRGKEMEEGLLVALLDTYVEQRTNCTEQELEAYFGQHRSDYGWGVPHFRGAVIHCQDKKEAKRIKKYLQSYPEELWQDAWERMPDDVSKDSRMVAGLFAIGENPYVDKLVFKCGTFEPLESYPYTWVLGKKLKKGPKELRDVREKVARDCKKDKKEAEMRSVMRKYALEMDEEVLKTVNREGNK